MASFRIYGEIGTDEVTWQIPEFYLLRKLLDNSNNEFLFKDVSKKYSLKMYQYDTYYITPGQNYPKSSYLSVYMDDDRKQANLNSQIRFEKSKKIGQLIQTECMKLIFNIGTRSDGKELGFPRRVLDSDEPKSGTVCLVWTPEIILNKPTLPSNTKAVAQSAELGLAGDLEKEFSNKQFADTKLLCNGDMFGCHKFILAARSPVFNAMFNNEMKENINKEVNLDSMKPEILKASFTLKSKREKI